MLCLEQSEPALWVGVAGVGLFMSSIFPTTIALAEYYIDLTGEAQCKNNFSLGSVFNSQMEKGEITAKVFLT